MTFSPHVHMLQHTHVQYRSHGTYTRVKKFTRVISTHHASGVTIFLEFEYSSDRVQELECSSGLRVRGLECSNIRARARVRTKPRMPYRHVLYRRCDRSYYRVRSSEDATLCPWIRPTNPLLLLLQGRRLPPCHA